MGGGRGGGAKKGGVGGGGVRKGRGERKCTQEAADEKWRGPSGTHPDMENERASGIRYCKSYHSILAGNHRKCTKIQGVGQGHHQTKRGYTTTDSSTFGKEFEFSCLSFIVAPFSPIRRALDRSKVGLSYCVRRSNHTTRKEKKRKATSTISPIMASPTHAPGPVAPSLQTPIPSSSTSSAASQGIVDRSRKFIEEHKLLVLGAAVLAVSGAGYYLYQSSSSSPSGPSSRRLKDEESGLLGDEKNGTTTGTNAATGSSSSSSKKKKKSKSKKKAGTSLGSGDQGPLLEERDPEEVARLLEKRERERANAKLTAGVDEESPSSSAAGAGAGGESGLAGGFLNKESSKKPAATTTATTTETATSSGDKPSYLEGIPTGPELAALSPTERKTFATTLKNRGNKLYSQKDYPSAIDCYTKALEIADKEEAVFYSNRAACYQNMQPPQYEQVVRDCNAALKLDAQYVKALNRRATAYEALGRDEEALKDFTATTIMERFQNDAAASSVDRVLKKIAAKKAEEIIKTREPSLPSNTFVAAYLGAFRPRAKPELPVLPEGSVNTGNATLDKAFDAQSAGDYVHAFTLVNEAIEQGLSPDWKVGQAEALNLRGTYKFLLGDTAGAKEDFEKSLDLVPDFVQSLVKVASVHMEMGDPAGAFGDFEAAIRHNPNDPDIYYHRGQREFWVQIIAYFLPTIFHTLASPSTDPQPFFVRLPSLSINSSSPHSLLCQPRIRTSCRRLRKIHLAR